MAPDEDLRVTPSPAGTYELVRELGFEKHPRSVRPTLRRQFAAREVCRDISELSVDEAVKGSGNEVEETVKRRLDRVIDRQLHLRDTVPNRHEFQHAGDFDISAT